MRRRRLTLAMVFAACAWLIPGLADADLKLVTITVKGMVCQG